MEDTYHHVAELIHNMSHLLLAGWKPEDFGGYQNISLEGNFEYLPKLTPPKLFVVAAPHLQRDNLFTGLYHHEDVFIRFFYNYEELEQNKRLMQRSYSVLQSLAKPSCLITRWIYGRSFYMHRTFYFAVCNTAYDGQSFVDVSSRHVYTMSEMPFVNRLYFQLYKQVVALSESGIMVITHPRTTLIPKNMADGCLGILPLFVYDHKVIKAIPRTLIPRFVGYDRIAGKGIFFVARYCIAKMFTLHLWENAAFDRCSKYRFSAFVENYMDFWERIQNLNFGDMSLGIALFLELKSVRNIKSFIQYASRIPRQEFFRRCGCDRSTFIRRLAKSMDTAAIDVDLTPLPHEDRKKIVQERKSEGCAVMDAEKSLNEVEH